MYAMKYKETIKYHKEKKKLQIKTGVLVFFWA